MKIWILTLCFISGLTQIDAAYFIKIEDESSFSDNSFVCVQKQEVIEKRFKQMELKWFLKETNIHIKYGSKKVLRGTLRTEILNLIQQYEIRFHTNTLDMFLFLYPQLMKALIQEKWSYH